MINAIYDKLFAYGDKLQKEGKESDRAIVHECENLVHEAWTESYNSAVRINKEPADKVEEIVLSIPDIAVFRDKTDKTIFYELDDCHFDSAPEVLKYVIECRETYRKRAVASAKTDILKYIQKEIAKYNMDNIAKPSYVSYAKVIKTGVVPKPKSMRKKKEDK